MRYLIDKISMEAARRLRTNGGKITPCNGRYAMDVPRCCRLSGQLMWPVMRMPDGSFIRFVTHASSVEIDAV
jgi:hypothetical protein